MTVSLVAGLALVMGVGALFVLSRPLRSRHRPSPEESAVQYRRLAPVVAGLAALAGAMLVLGLVISALR